MKPNPTTSPPQILIVDDTPTNIDVLLEYLSEMGFNLSIAKSGERALEICQYNIPDLILLDVMMPGIDGFETCRRLKAETSTKNVPIIFMTALAETDDKVKGFKAGGVDYITKPIQQEELLARVTTHLQLQDLTNRLEQKVEERTAALNQAYQQLERWDRIKLDFLRVMSHEFRTPINIISGNIELLQLRRPDLVEDEALKDIFDTIQDGNQWLVENLTSILDVTIVQNELTSLTKTTVNLAALIKEICRGFEVPLAKRHQNLKQVNLTTLASIDGDRKLLRKLFYHLIINAIKYTPDGGQIRISGKMYHPPNEPPMVEIVISDTGVGLDPNNLELIFEEFYRAEPMVTYSSGKTKFKGGGPGFGLAIAKGVVMAHGGQIWAESEGASFGSNFYVRLPIN